MSETPGVFGQIKEGLIGLFVMEPKPSKPTEINEQVVADIISSKLGFVGRKDADKWAGYSFTSVDVLNQMGFEDAINPLWEESEHIKKYPKETIATRRVLTKLVDKKVLDSFSTENPDKDGERLYYLVLDDTKLRELSK